MDRALDNIIRRRDENNRVDHNAIRAVILNEVFQDPPAPIRVPGFDLNNIEDKYIKLFFRFEREHIPRLARTLRIPDQIKTKSRFSVSGIEGLCILLRRLAYPSRLCDLESLFRRSESALSEISNHLNAYIVENHGHLLANIGNLPWLNRNRLEIYAQAVSAKGAAIQNCWAFIDGTARAICRPTENQEEYYSGHKRFHCVKYQSLISPDGLIVSLLGAYPGRRHDAFVFRVSELYNQLEQHTRFPGANYVIYGDQAYGLRELLMCPYPGRGINADQQNFNASMSVVRQSVEWGFQKIISEFAFLDLKKKQKLLLQEIELFYKTGVLLTNCHSCLYNNQTSIFFNVHPLELEEYIGN